MTEKSGFKNQEQKEQIIDAKTLTGQELFDLIYSNESEPQDDRFLGSDDGGVFKYFRIENLINIHKKRENFFYPVIRVDDKIVALCEMEKSPYEENLYWITGVSTDPAYQGKGYASHVLEETFRFARERGFDLEASTYTDEGSQKLKSVCRKLAIQYGVEFREQPVRY